MIFRKIGGRQSCEKCKWNGKVIEKGYKYLQRNNEPGTYINEIIKKATIAINTICNIGEQKFIRDFRKGLI